jgi:sugar lactone lactonase YvrE
LWLGALIGSTVVGGLGGGGVGAVDALPADTVREAEAALTRALSGLRVQERIRDQVFQLARRKTLHPVVVLAEHGPPSPDEPATYGSVASRGIDSILEISILTIGLAGDWDINPPLALVITGRARLVRVQDGSEIHETKLEYRSGVRLFTEWAANDAQLFREGFDRAIDYLAEETVEKHFLLLLPELNSPWGVAVDAAGTLFVADTRNHRIRKFEMVTGIVTTVAGKGRPGFEGDGGPATGAQLRSPATVAVDMSGNLLIADEDNHLIRKVDAVTGYITTVAGTGEHGFAGDGGPATIAQLAFPRGVARDVSGTLFIADTWNHRIRKVEAATGVITTVAGTGESGFAGDGGPAISAQLARPAGAAVDTAGNLFIADQDNHRIRKVEAATGVITTVAGTGESGFAGDGGPAISAQLYSPATVVVDVSGNLFIADQDNHRVRKVEGATGLITTVAGGDERLGEKFSDRGPAATAPPSSPEGVAHDSN